MPTNAHGGVNFNRVPLHHRQQMQQMQQAGFLNGGGSYGRSKGATTYPGSQPAAAGYTAEFVRKKVMSELNVPWIPLTSSPAQSLLHRCVHSAARASANRSRLAGPAQRAAYGSPLHARLKEAILRIGVETETDMCDKS